MKRFEAHDGLLPPAVLSRYASAVARFKAREDRFSSQTLLRLPADVSDGFQVRAAAGDVPAEILLYDEIGYWGVTAKDFVLALAAIGPGPLRIRINSPGGDVFDGLAIYNALRARTEPVTVVIDGIAASAASFIAMAGKTVEMPEQAMLMIHNAWGICVGNRNDLLDMAAVLEKIDGQIAAIYANKSGKPISDMTSAMNDETWYTSTEAKAAGLCDAIIVPAQSTQPAAPAAPAAPGARSPLRIAALDIAARTTRIFAKNELPAYDPDGDGDNDAEEARGMIAAAAVLLNSAISALTGGAADDDTEEGADVGAPPMPMVPGTHAEAPAVEAATEPAASTTEAPQASPDDKLARLRRLRLAEADAA